MPYVVIYEKKNHLPYIYIYVSEEAEQRVNYKLSTIDIVIEIKSGSGFSG